MTPPETIKQRLVAEWIGKANTDLDVTEHFISEGVIFPSAIAFHSQQAAEKYIKAFLVRHEIDFPKTHDLNDLLNKVQTINSGLADRLRNVIILTPYGVELRYPGDRPEPSSKEAREVVDLAKMVHDAILPLLPNISVSEQSN